MKLTKFADKIDQNKSLELLAMLDKENEELKLRIAELLMNGHLCEMTAMAKVEKMRAPVLMSAPNEKWTTDDRYQMCTYMSAMGLMPERCKEMVDKAYLRAKELASKLGVSAPHLSEDINMWDCWYNMAMVLSDHWYTINGDMEKASMMAYEILSDVDKDRLD